MQCSAVAYVEAVVVVADVGDNVVEAHVQRQLVLVRLQRLVQADEERHARQRRPVHTSSSIE